MRLGAMSSLRFSVLAGLLLASGAKAELFTFQIFGQVTDEALFGCGVVANCGVLTGSYSFDSSAPDSNGDPSIGLYDATDITLSIDGTLFFSSASGKINVLFAPGILDFYGLLATGTAAEGSTAVFSMGLGHAFGGILSSDALPTDPAALAGLLPGFFNLDGTNPQTGEDTFQLQGTIEEVSRVTAVPEPSSIALLGAIGFALLLHRRRSIRH